MAVRQERVQPHPSACHLRAMRTGLHRLLAGSHGHPCPSDLRLVLTMASAATGPTSVRV
jgi:hypothetical protein